MTRDAVAVVADDLTGAGDCVVQFARAGWPGHLVLGTDLPGTDLPGTDGAALAVVTDARPLADDAAARATAGAVGALVDAGATRLYVKIDSTMRGSVPGQVAGALSAWRGRHAGAFAVVCPSYPALGRTVHDGVLLVDGTPVADSPAGRDPVTPVRRSDLTALLPGSARVGTAGCDATTLAARLAAAGREHGTLVVDAADDAALDLLAAAVALLGPSAVPVGSAGLAAALGARWDAPAAQAVPPAGPVDRVLVVLSSLHEVSLRQAEELVAAEPGTRVVEAGPGSGAVEPAPTVLVRTPAPADGAPGRDGAARAAGGLADAVAAAVAADRPDALVLVGGDGARAVLARLGARSVHVTGSVAEGVPVGRLVGGPADGTVVVTKAGGFGTPRTVVDVLTNLRSYCSHQEVNP
ncbi:MAG TPA: four-carbon acid sugar kinase family protein [Promicromonospora sp.]|nr:four-carbon acid sugar kinase family protein [Promicromonospora sp.]